MVERQLFARLDTSLKLKEGGKLTKLKLYILRFLHRILYKGHS
jgi:hypothetical protein